MCVIAERGATVNLQVYCDLTIALDNGGCMVLEGEANYRIVKSKGMYGKAQIGGFIYAPDINSLYLYEVEILGRQNEDVTQGAVYVSTPSYKPSTSVTLDSVSTKYVEGSQDGACLHIERIANVQVQNSEFITCWAPMGKGGGILIEGVNSFTMTNTSFQGCQAQYGSAVACQGSIPAATADVESVSFMDSQSTALSIDFIDVYNDGSCLSPFWNSHSLCPSGCDSCQDTVCGISSQTRNCLCYCSGNDPNCLATPTSSSSPSRSNSPSRSVSPSPVIQGATPSRRIEESSLNSS